MDVHSQDSSPEEQCLSSTSSGNALEVDSSMSGEIKGNQLSLEGERAVSRTISKEELTPCLFVSSEASNPHLILSDYLIAENVASRSEISTSTKPNQDDPKDHYEDISSTAHHDSKPAPFEKVKCPATSMHILSEIMLSDERVSNNEPPHPPKDSCLEKKNLHPSSYPDPKGPSGSDLFCNKGDNFSNFEENFLFTSSEDSVFVASSIFQDSPVENTSSLISHTETHFEDQMDCSKNENALQIPDSCFKQSHQVTIDSFVAKDDCNSKDSFLDNCTYPQSNSASGKCYNQETSAHNKQVDDPLPSYDSSSHCMTKRAFQSTSSEDGNSSRLSSLFSMPFKEVEPPSTQLKPSQFSSSFNYDEDLSQSVEKCTNPISVATSNLLRSNEDFDLNQATENVEIIKKERKNVGECTQHLSFNNISSFDAVNLQGIDNMKMCSQLGQLVDENLDFLGFSSSLDEKISYPSSILPLQILERGTLDVDSSLEEAKCSPVLFACNELENECSTNSDRLNNKYPSFEDQNFKKIDSKTNCKLQKKQLNTSILSADEKLSPSFLSVNAPSCSKEPSIEQSCSVPSSKERQVLNDNSARHVDPPLLLDELQKDSEMSKSLCNKRLEEGEQDMSKDYSIDYPTAEQFSTSNQMPQMAPNSGATDDAFTNLCIEENISDSKEKADLLTCSTYETEPSGYINLGEFLIESSGEKEPSAYKSDDTLNEILSHDVNLSSNSVRDKEPSNIFDEELSGCVGSLVLSKGTTLDPLISTESSSYLKSKEPSSSCLNDTQPMSVSIDEYDQIEDFSSPSQSDTVNVLGKSPHDICESNKLEASSKEDSDNSAEERTAFNLLKRDDSSSDSRKEEASVGYMKSEGFFIGSTKDESSSLQDLVYGNTKAKLPTSPRNEGIFSCDSIEGDDLNIPNESKKSLLLTKVESHDHFVDEGDSLISGSLTAKERSSLSDGFLKGIDIHSGREGLLPDVSEEAKSVRSSIKEEAFGNSENLERNEKVPLKVLDKQMEKEGTKILCSLDFSNEEANLLGLKEHDCSTGGNSTPSSLNNEDFPSVRFFTRDLQKESLLMQEGWDGKTKESTTPSLPLSDDEAFCSTNTEVGGRNSSSLPPLPNKEAKKKSYHTNCEMSLENPYDLNSNISSQESSRVEMTETPEIMKNFAKKETGESNTSQALPIKTDKFDPSSTIKVETAKPLSTLITLENEISEEIYMSDALKSPKELETSMNVKSPEELVSSSLLKIETSELSASELSKIELSSSELQETKTSEELAASELSKKQTSEKLPVSELPKFGTLEEFEVSDLPKMETSEELSVPELPKKETPEELATLELPKVETAQDLLASELPKMKASEELVPSGLPKIKTSEELAPNIENSEELLMAELQKIETPEELTVSELPKMEISEEWSAPELQKMKAFEASNTSKIDNENLHDSSNNNEIANTSCLHEKKEKALKVMQIADGPSIEPISTKRPLESCDELEKKRLKLDDTSEESLVSSPPTVGLEVTQSGDFTWDDYLEYTKSEPVPPTCFQHVEYSIESGVEVGQYLEISVETPLARNRSDALQCVSSPSGEVECTTTTFWPAKVVAVCGNLIRVKYVSLPLENRCGSPLEFWSDLTSPNLHELGHGASQEEVLHPPQFADCLTSFQVEELKKVVMRLMEKVQSIPSEALREPREVFARVKEGDYFEILSKNNANEGWPAKVLKNCGGRLLLQYCGSESNESSFWLFLIHQRVKPLFWIRNQGESYRYKVPECLPHAETVDLIKDLEGSPCSSRTPDVLKHSDTCLPPHCFELGDQVEALHPKSLETFHLATVTKIIDKCFFKVDVGDYSWTTSINDPHLVPLGFSKEHSISLVSAASSEATSQTDPKNDVCLAPFPEKFSRSSASDLGFEIGQKLETGDPKREELNCVATIENITGHFLWLKLDSSPHRAAFARHCLSSCLFPAGWSLCHGHLLQLPLTYAPKIPSGIKEENSSPDDPSLLEEAPEAKMKQEENLKCSVWCPELFINHWCFPGPYLSKTKVANQPQSVGPGPLGLVLREVITSTINAGYIPTRVLRELQQLPQVNPTWYKTQLKAKFKRCIFKADVYIPSNSMEIQLLLKELSKVLQCCPNLWSEVSTGDSSCPFSCTSQLSSSYGGKVSLKKKKAGKKRLLFSIRSLGVDEVADRPEDMDVEEEYDGDLEEAEREPPPPTTYDDDHNPRTLSPSELSRKLKQKGVVTQLEATAAKTPKDPPKSAADPFPCGEIDAPTDPSSSSKLQLEMGGFQVASVLEPAAVATDPLNWSVDDVEKYFLSQPDTRQFAFKVKEQEIDGRALLLLNLPSLIYHLRLPHNSALLLAQYICKVKLSHYLYFQEKREVLA